MFDSVFLYVNTTHGALYMKQYLCCFVVICIPTSPQRHACVCVVTGMFVLQTQPVHMVNLCL